MKRVDEEASNSSSSDSEYEDPEFDEMFGTSTSAKRLFPKSPETPKSSKVTSSDGPTLTAEKNKQEDNVSSAKKLDMLQKSVFTPVRSKNQDPRFITKYVNDESSVQPKVLNLRINEAEKAELLRAKRSFVAAGPPQLKNKPSIEEFYDWKIAMIQYLELVPGYQEGMLEIPPNLEGISETDLEYIRTTYDMIYKILDKATQQNKLVRLKTNDTNKLPVRHLSYWWSTVCDLFEPTDGQIKELKKNYESHKQKENQTSIEFAEEMEIKANELRTLGLYYTSKEIGNQIHENLLKEPKLFAFTYLMAQRIPCDLQSILKVLKTYEETIMGEKASLAIANMAESHSVKSKNNAGRKFSNKPMRNNVNALTSSRNKANALATSTDNVNALSTSSISDNDDEISIDEVTDKDLSIDDAVKKLRNYKKIIRNFNQSDNNVEEHSNAEEMSKRKEDDRRKHNNYALLPQVAKRTRSRSHSMLSDRTSYKRARSRSPESRRRTVEYSRKPRNKYRSRSPPDQGNQRSTFRSDTYGPKTSHYSANNYPNNRNRGGNPSQNKNHNDK